MAPNTFTSSPIYSKMVFTFTRYRLFAVDHTNDLYVDETFDSLEALIRKYGEQFQLTRRRCDSIRLKKNICRTKYKHIGIQEIDPDPYYMQNKLTNRSAEIRLRKRLFKELKKHHQNIK